MTFECWCKTCDKWQSTGDVEFVDVSENVYGEDSFTFICPGCDEKQTSLVRSNGTGEQFSWKSLFKYISRMPLTPYEKEELE